MNDPDVISRVDRYADDVAGDPVVRQGLGPHGVHFEARGLQAGGFNNSFLFEYEICRRENCEDGKKTNCDYGVSFRHVYPHSILLRDCPDVHPTFLTSFLT